MPRQELWLGFGDLRKLILQHIGDAGMERTTRLAEQRAIRSVLHKGVLEQIARMRRHALPK